MRQRREEVKVVVLAEEGGSLQEDDVIYLG